MNLWLGVPAWGSSLFSWPRTAFVHARLCLLGLKVCGLTYWDPVLILSGAGCQVTGAWRSSLPPPQHLGFWDLPQGLSCKCLHSSEPRLKAESPEWSHSWIRLQFSSALITSSLSVSLLWFFTDSGEKKRKISSVLVVYFSEGR